MCGCVDPAVMVGTGCVIDEVRSEGWLAVARSNVAFWYVLFAFMSVCFSGIGAFRKL
jgi:hypothetical protein